MKLISIHPIVAAAILLCLPAEAEQPLMVGSSLEIESVLATATDAFIAVFESHGQLVLGATSVTLYRGARVRGLQRLIKDRQVPVAVNFRVLYFIEKSEGEKLPSLGVPYLVIGTRGSDGFDVEKVVVPTASNVHAVLQIYEKRGVRVEPVTESEIKSLDELHSHLYPGAASPATASSALNKNKEMADEVSGMPVPGEWAIHSKPWIMWSVVIATALALLGWLGRKHVK